MSSRDEFQASTLAILEPVIFESPPEKTLAKPACLSAFGMSKFRIELREERVLSNDMPRTNRTKPETMDRREVSFVGLFLLNGNRGNAVSHRDLIENI